MCTVKVSNLGGPLLFNYSFNDLPSICNNSVDIIIFADEAKIF